MAGILVYALTNEGAVNKNSLGAVSQAAKFASELGTEAHAVVVGDVSDDAAASLGTYGAAKVYRAKDAPEGVSTPAVDVLAKLFADNDYDYAVFGGGLLGFEIGAGLAARIGAGITAEVTGAKVEGGKLIAQRPILGDSLLSESNYKGKGVLIGRTNAFEATQTGSPAAIEDISVELSEAAGKVRLITRGEQRGADVNIEDANVLIAGGRGLGAAEGFKLADDLAAAFGGGAAVGATRAVVDAGWFPYAGQIGQTGKTVAPKLYVAAGISGAIQHKVGMQGSENIIAINKDANAPIFEFSDLGIVGDVQKVLPALTDAVKAKKGS
ncbi:MAG: electron transfer flavoprotein subunit alpha/FixB family protein [Solirubrobacteraceae bacterium]|nr:electron transfer flavoprotein subunit alpha/FixB family protein [Solirubrobacteraceae bacterium]